MSQLLATQMRPCASQGNYGVLSKRGVSWYCFSQESDIIVYVQAYTLSEGLGKIGSCVRNLIRTLRSMCATSIKNAGMEKTWRQC